MSNNKQIVSVARVNRSQKSTKKVLVSPCKCNVCGQASNARPETEHFSCQGFAPGTVQRKLMQALWGRIKFPDAKKGTWIPV